MKLSKRNKTMPQKILTHEFIGSIMKVIESKNPTLLGLEGKIIDETQNTITIKTKNSTKKILKNQVKMKIETGNKSFIIIGKDLVGRPQDRIKK